MHSGAGEVDIAFLGGPVTPLPEPGSLASNGAAAAARA
jgi:hypothetical protein